MWLSRRAPTGCTVLGPAGFRNCSSGGKEAQNSSSFHGCVWAVFFSSFLNSDEVRGIPRRDKPWSSSRGLARFFEVGHGTTRKADESPISDATAKLTIEFRLDVLTQTSVFFGTPLKDVPICFVRFQWAIQDRPNLSGNGPFRGKRTESNGLRTEKLQGFPITPAWGNRLILALFHIKPGYVGFFGTVWGNSARV